MTLLLISVEGFGSRAGKISKIIVHMSYQGRVHKSFLNNISKSDPGMSAFLLRMRDSSASFAVSEAGIR